MKFLLNYRGPLKSNGKPKDKHELRKYFHPQLEDLWKRLPLREQAKEFLDPEYELTAIKTVENKTPKIGIKTNQLVVKYIS